MLTKDLLRVSRAGGDYRPQFAGPEARETAARTVGVFQGHVGHPRADLDAALDDLEREAADFKLVRGFAKLLEREAAFETRATVDPLRARRAAFAASEAVGVVTAAERETALARAADDLGVAPGDLDDALYADRDARQVLASFDARWEPDALIAQYNLSLAQTALFDATELRVRTADPRGLVGAIKRLGLMYEVRPTDAGQEVVLTGPDALFRRTRRYGTRFARVLRTVVGGEGWRVAATVDDRGTERELVLTPDDPVSVPDADPVAEVSYDSDVEREFAARFAALDLDWSLVREPDLLPAGDRVMIPDFAFDYDHADFRVHFEIMGFWTPEYVAKKLDQLDAVEGVEMLVAVDESLGVGEDVEARDARAIPYRGSVRVKDVRDALRRYESDLVAESASALPDELAPGDAVVSLTALADRHGVSEDALAGAAFPEHELVGRTLVRPETLADAADALDAGMAYEDAAERLRERGLDGASAVLSCLGYTVEWDGLAGGTLRRTESDAASDG